MLLALLSTSTPTPTPTETPTPSPGSSGGLSGLADVAQNSIESLQAQSASACMDTSISVCRLVVRVTGNQVLGQVLEIALGTPFRLLLIIGFGILVRRILHRLIDGLSERIATGAANSTPSRTASTGIGTGGTEATEAEAEAEAGAGAGAGTGAGARAGTGAGARAGTGAGAGSSAVGASGTRAGASASPLLTTRRQARSRTLAQVLRSIATIAIVAIVTLMVLQELHFPVAPLLAGVSVFGVALGFGAQSLVRDVVSGMFMIVEDQYGVGDVVDVGVASGSVEAVGLRITRLRDVNGTVWYVRNGEILRVGNQSQGWARAVIDVNIGYSEDINRAESVLLDTAQRLRADDRFAAFIMDEPEVWGVEAMTTDGVVIRVVVKTQPLQQWAVARELRRRIKLRFEADGIEMRTVPRTVIINEEEEAEPQTAARTDDLER